MVQLTVKHVHRLALPVGAGVDDPASVPHHKASWLVLVRKTAGTDSLTRFSTYAFLSDNSHDLPRVIFKLTQRGIGNLGS